MSNLENFIYFLVDRRFEIGEQVVEHLWLTLTSLFLAIILGGTIGIIISKNVRASKPVMTLVNGVQTIPSLALLGFLLPVLGIGEVPAITALFLYALLPIVRNIFTGINGIDPAVVEAARGIGMSDYQILTKVELPLAVPVIFAGIRTAFVINVGVATLCALIAAGGLGEFIFRGIATNNVNMVLAGAIPAALMALVFDFLLGMIQKHISKIFKPALITLGVGMLVFSSVFTISNISNDEFIGGFPSEFIEREDGYRGLVETYKLPLETVELEIGLMYQALKSEEVDVISGFSTDGRIETFNLRSLIDDKNYFPPYHAAPLIRQETLNKFPQINSALNHLYGRMDNETMINLNYEVDQNNRSAEKVAIDYLESIGIDSLKNSQGRPNITIGSKNFTESYILAYLFGHLIEHYTGLDVEYKLGFGGTKLLFDALSRGDIDLYPEYTGTGLLVILDPPNDVLSEILYQKDVVYEYVYDQFKKKHNLVWLEPLGFNNTYALMMREEHASRLGIESLSDLSRYLNIELD